MQNINHLIDDYIAKAQPFAQPVLIHLRKLVHKACPNVKEEIKWSCPHFSYQGKILCSMAAFKQHCSFGFWLESSMTTMKLYRNNTDKTAGMGSFGKLTSLKDLPTEKELLKCIKEAMELIELGATLKKASPKKSAEIPVPKVLQAALDKNKKAKQVFTNFPPSQRKEYIAWINDAKTAATRISRIETTIEWVSEGKGRNWKYEKKKG